MIRRAYEARGEIMLKRVCDRCGDEIKRFYHVYVYEYKLASKAGEIHKEFDLCKDCYEPILGYLVDDEEEREE